MQPLILRSRMAAGEPADAAPSGRDRAGTRLSTARHEFPPRGRALALAGVGPAGLAERDVQGRLGCGRPAREVFGSDFFRPLEYHRREQRQRPRLDDHDPEGAAGNAAVLPVGGSGSIGGAVERRVLEGSFRHNSGVTGTIELTLPDDGNSDSGFYLYGGRNYLWPETCAGRRRMGYSSISRVMYWNCRSRSISSATGSCAFLAARAVRSASNDSTAAPLSS